jgi:hypothetical protein
MEEVASAVFYGNKDVLIKLLSEGFKINSKYKYPLGCVRLILLTSRRK